MSKQYDGIQEEYDDWRRGADAEFEKENFLRTLLPLVKGASVLELACGSGFYTFDLVSWGIAHSIHAVDVSPVMLSAAEADPRRSRLPFPQRVTFQAADVSLPQSFPAAPYDAVVAGWLLTYAPNRETLTRMLRTVHQNLKEGGLFVTTVINPSSDPVTAFTDGTLAFWSPGAYRLEPLQPVADGVAIRCCARSPTGKAAEWRSFYLSREAYAAAARDAGFQQEIEYRRPLALPEVADRHRPSAEIDALVAGLTKLHFHILILRK